jgi:hypothetical protein
MSNKLNLTFDVKKAAAPSARAWLFAGAMILMSAMAVAQESPASSRAREDLGFFGNISRWFAEQGEKFNATFRDAGKGVENFGREASVAAKTTVDTAKDAADAMARIPNSRVIAGHESRHDDGRSLPAQSIAVRPHQRARLPDRDFRLPRSLPIAV